MGRQAFGAQSIRPKKKRRLILFQSRLENVSCARPASAGFAPAGWRPYVYAYALSKLPPGGATRAFDRQIFFG
jgi:hypothetical protein